MSNDLTCGYMLVFTFACTQKKYYATSHVKFATIHLNFMDTMYVIEMNLKYPNYFHVECSLKLLMKQGIYHIYI